MSETDSNDKNPSKLGNARRISFVFSDSIVFGGASVFKTSFSLLTFPILTRHFSKAEYGTIDLFGMITSLLVILCIFGQDSAIMRFFYDSNDRSYRRQMISQSLLLQVACAALLIPIPLIFADWIGAQLSSAVNSGTLVRLVVATAPFEIGFALACLVCRINFQRGRYVLLTVGVVMVRVAVLIAAIYALDIGVTGVFWINFGMSIFGCSVGLWYIRDWLVVPSDFRVLKPLLPYALPLGVIMLITAVLPVFERLFVEDTIGPDALGYYAAGAKVAMLISIPIAAFTTAWGPFSLAIAREPDAEQTYQAIFRLLVVMVVPLVLVLDIMGSQILDLLAGSGYTAGSVVVFPLACGIAIGFLGSVTSVGLAIRKRMIFRLYAFVLFLVVGFVAIITLGNLFGLQGVAYGALIGQLVLATSLYLFAKMVSGISWNTPPVIVFCGVFLIGGFALNVTLGSSHFAFSILHAGAVLVVCPLVGILLLFSPSERRSALAAIRRVRR